MCMHVQVEHLSVRVCVGRVVYWCVHACMRACMLVFRACVAACVRVSVACVRGCMCLCECCVDAVRVHACVCV